MDRNSNLKFTSMITTRFKTLSFVGSLILATESTQLLTTHFTDQEIALILKYETKRVERMLHYNLEGVGTRYFHEWNAKDQLSEEEFWFLNPNLT